MFKNQQVTGAHLAGTPNQGARSSHNKVDMPAKNHQTFTPNLGSAVKSKFGEGVQGAVAQKVATQPKDSKANIPTRNDQLATGYLLGTTKHSVGSVPSYLRQK